MMIYQEKIAPPLAPLSEEEQMKLITDSIASEDRWVKDFIERLAWRHSGYQTLSTVRRPPRLAASFICRSLIRRIPVRVPNLFVA
jgi:hypothetical protein